MPQFRIRRLQRRLRTRGQADPRARAASRMFDLLIGRARRTTDRPTRYPVFATRLGRRRLWIVTRVIAPRHVEVIFIRRAALP